MKSPQLPLQDKIIQGQAMAADLPFVPRVIDDVVDDVDFAIGELYPA